MDKKEAVALYNQNIANVCEVLNENIIKGMLDDKAFRTMDNAIKTLEKYGDLEIDGKVIKDDVKDYAISQLKQAISEYNRYVTDINNAYVNLTRAGFDVKDFE